MCAHLGHAAWVIVTLFVCSAPPTLAQSPSHVDERCPADYRLVETVCASRSGGDVANVAPAASAPIVEEQGGASGYWAWSIISIAQRSRFQVGPFGWAQMQPLGSMPGSIWAFDTS
jgi:hypothetical protein